MSFRHSLNDIIIVVCYYAFFQAASSGSPSDSALLSPRHRGRGDGAHMSVRGSTGKNLGLHHSCGDELVQVIVDKRWFRERSFF